MKLTRLRADACLLLVAVLWGAAFVAQKNGNESIGPFLFVGIRFLISTLVLLPLAMRETKKETKPLQSTDVSFACLIGVFLFAGISLQQIALITTSATNGGFLTALYIAFVPIVAWFLQRTSFRPSILLACAISIVGAWMLADCGVAKKWMPGDSIILVTDIIWAFHITLLSKFIIRTHRPFFLSCVQCGVAGILGLAVAAMREPFVWHAIQTALPYILYTAIVAGCIGYTIQIFAQRHTPPAEAALIMSMESVFAALSGAIFLGERLTMLASIGCALILLGVIIIEMSPIWRRERDAV